MGIGGSVLSILTQFLLNRSQHVMVDGCRNKLANVVSGVPQGSVLGPLLFLLYTLELFPILENLLIGYTDDSTLMAVVPSPGCCRTILKDSDDFVILGVTFDSKMTFEKHLRSVSRAASQRLGISRNSWRSSVP